MPRVTKGGYAPTNPRVTIYLRWYNGPQLTRRNIMGPLLNSCKVICFGWCSTTALVPCDSLPSLSLFNIMSDNMQLYYSNT